jgi:two-component system chemotaxis response regulator CheB
MEKVKVDIRKLVVIGGSAGSLEALFRLIPGLRHDFPHAIVLVLHRKSTNDSLLTDLLSTKTTLIIKEIEDKDSLEQGHIHIAPGDYHVLFEKDGTLALDDSEKVAFSRPSIDVAFQSAAEAWGKSLVCILLSGANSDGSEGFKHVRELGGATVAQLPGSAEVPFMPQQAIDLNLADFVFDLPELIQFLNRL